MKNIVFIFPDQMRADYLGCYGADFAKTPNIDQLSKEGVQYNNAISPSPICIPARASLLTGKNAIETGVLENSLWLRPDYKELGIKTWPKQLSEVGYETIAIGKMHFYPWDTMEGFNQRIISEDKRHHLVQDDYYDYLKSKGLEKYKGIEYPEYTINKGAMDNPLDKEDQADPWIARQVCDYIDQYDKDQPFAMMVGLLNPHDPYDPDQSHANLFRSEDMPDSIPGTDDTNSFLSEHIESFKEPWAQIDYSEFTNDQQKKVKAYYSACIHEVDLCVGKIIESLKKKGIYEDTIIIFSSDHGDFVGDFGLVGKYYFYEPSIHIPLIIRDSDIKQSGVKKEELVSLTDMYATILHLAGIKNTETKDSKIFSCYKKQEGERVVLGATDKGYMLRKGKWKYCRYASGLTQLFNMEEDKQEQYNIAYLPETLEIMKALDSEMQKQLINSLFNSNKEKTSNFTVENEPEKYYKRGWRRPYPVKLTK